MVSLIILALGVPRRPYATTNPVALHLPAGVIPEQANASLSSCRIEVSDKEDPWCPHVAEVKHDPE